MSTLADEVSILVVDDREDKLLSIEAVLGDLQVTVVRASSGREALRHVLSQDFAAILLDVNMPGMDGFETATLIRQRKRSEKIPILFITAHDDELFAARGYELGAVDYLLTPVTPTVLRAKVTVFIDLHRMNLEIRQQAAKLEHRANQLSALAAELTQAEQRERRRLAQILHDHIQQMLVAAKMRLGLMGKRLSKHDLQAIAAVEELLTKSIDASRSLTVQLSPPMLYDGGLKAALQWLGRQMLKDHGLRVDVDAEDGANLLDENMRALAFQAVRELLFNTVKHAGSAAARVSVARADGGRVRIRVEDDGAGFDSTALERQAHASERFGLFSIGERVALMNGTFEIDSAPGAGARFTLHLPDQPLSATPMTSDEDCVAHEPTVRPEQPSGAARRIRVLVADDHPSVRKGLIALLGTAPDIEVVAEASDGVVAVEQALRVQPDVVLMDMSMPRLSGLEATKLILASLPDLKVIGLSMLEYDDMAPAMMQAGAVAYLAKGGAAQTLVAAIRAAAAAPRVHGSTPIHEIPRVAS